MINRINNYLLTHYPIIWNVRIVPVALLVCSLYIGLFLLNFIFTSTSVWHDQWNILGGGGTVIFYAGIILSCILFFIFWLVRYNRINGLRAFYAVSTKWLYIEWFCIFAVCFMIGIIPYVYTLGETTKWKFAISKKEYAESQKILNRVAILLPTSTYNYNLGSQQPLLVGDADVNRKKFDTRYFTYTEDAETPDNPIEYVGPSLLYYEYNNVHGKDEEHAIEISKVTNWLRTQNEDSLRATIQAFVDLQKKYSIKSGLTVDNWMNKYYKPPLYPVGTGSGDMYENSWENSRHSASLAGRTSIGYNLIDGYYRKVSSYNENNATDGFGTWYILVALNIALGLSMLIFSARLTSGRSWIYALLLSGVIAFLFSILTGIIALVNIYGNSWGVSMPILNFILMTVIAIVIGIKINDKDSKGRSKIYINLGIWYIPALLLWVLQIYLFSSKKTSSTSLDFTFYILVCNVIFTLVVMYPIMGVLRKWKALAEQ